MKQNAEFTDGLILSRLWSKVYEIFRTLYRGPVAVFNAVLRLSMSCCFVRRCMPLKVSLSCEVVEKRSKIGGFWALDF